MFTMGFGQSKEQQNNVALAQTVTNNELADTVNLNEILLIVIMVLLGIFVLHVLRSQCNKAFNGVMKNQQMAYMVPTGGSLPVVKVESPPPQGNNGARVVYS